MKESGGARSGPLMPVLFLGVLMGAMDIAILGPVIPSMKADFGATERDLALLFSIYVLFNLVGTPLMAKLSDTYGRRIVYIAAAAVGGIVASIQDKSSAYSIAFHVLAGVSILALVLSFWIRGSRSKNPEEARLGSGPAAKPKRAEAKVEAAPTSGIARGAMGAMGAAPPGLE
ncbi:MAG TPA: MFS transporter [Rectinemataceae bacterium]|nr:MFS transporter [Rectinemataceae bacterium]